MYTPVFTVILAVLQIASHELGEIHYLYTHANIREHCSWVHRDGDLATKKAKDLIRASVSRVYHQEPLEVKEVPVNPNTLIIGGGIAGITAALKIADSENKVYLVEREPSIGGHMIQLDKTFPTLDCSACITTPKMSDAGSHPNIVLLTYSEVTEVSGYIGNFTVKIFYRAGIRPTIIPQLADSGHDAFWSGQYQFFNALKEKNSRLLAGTKMIVTTCAEDYYILKNEYSVEAEIYHI